VKPKPASEAIKSHRKASYGSQHYTTLDQSSLNKLHIYYQTVSNAKGSKTGKSSSYPSFNSGCTGSKSKNTSFVGMRSQKIDKELFKKIITPESKKEQTASFSTNTSDQSLEAPHVYNPEIDKEFQTSNFNVKSNIADDETLGKHFTSVGDINSRLEFLCLQMTEQAIN